jgi:hypothetical protein
VSWNNDPATYREASKSRESLEAANNAFNEEVRAARTRHHVATVLVVLVVNFAGEDGRERTAVGMGWSRGSMSRLLNRADRGAQLDGQGAIQRAWRLVREERAPAGGWWPVLPQNPAESLSRSGQIRPLPAAEHDRAQGAARLADESEDVPS